jgi:hypothetical protein
MRKPHFGAVDGAISCALDDGEQVVIFGIEDDALSGSLRRARSERVSPMSSIASRRPLPSQIAP